ncbi:MAG: FAD/NAD(P)-binding protein [Thermoproteota archaeon]
MFVNPYLPEIVRVEDVRVETEDTKTFTLKLLQPERKLFPNPGQFILVGAMGVGEAPISVCSSPNGELQISVRKIGKVTSAIHEARKGELLHVRGPYGRGWPIDEVKGKELLLIGGGIGLAPLRSVALADIDARKITVCYGSRTPSLLLYREEYPVWEARGIDLDLTVDKPERGWLGKVGVVTKLLEQRSIDVEQTIAFVCGPPVMIKFTVRTLSSIGLKHDRIFVSLESRMRCGIGKCGHCHFGGKMVCTDGPVFSLEEAIELPRELAQF